MMCHEEIMDAAAADCGFVHNMGTGDNDVVVLAAKLFHADIIHVISSDIVIISIFIVGCTHRN